MSQLRTYLRLWALLALTFVTTAKTAHASQDPRWRWRTLETEHFRIHFPEHNRRVALRVAVIAEETHTRLTTELGWEPRRLCHFIIADDTDYAQGITYVGATNMIRLWPVAPEDGGVLDDFDDWLRTLITHEYTHLVHLDYTRGLPVVINAIFGDIYHPNHLNPGWLIEGYAIYEESTQSSGGRVRGSTFDMYLRAAVLEDAFLRLDQVSTGTRNFPQGNVEYLYGQGFVSYLVRRFGDDFPARLAEEISNELIPYGLNRAFTRVTGHTAVDLWADWRQSLIVGYTALRDRLTEEGLTPSNRLTAFGERMGAPRYSADGSRLYFYNTSEQGPAGIWSVDMETEEAEQTILTTGHSWVAPSPDGRFLYYSRGDRHWVIYQFQDIFRLDLATGHEERLTDGARARQPDLSPDGRTLAYGAWRSDSSDLWVAGAEGNAPRRLIKSEPGDQVFSPRFHPSGDKLAVSRWTKGGYRDIYLVDVADGSMERITHDRALDATPCFTPDGAWLVFSSDRSGVANLYGWNMEEERLYQITNVINGAFKPDISPDGEQIAFVGFSAIGYDLHVMPFDPATFRDPPPPLEREPIDRDAPDIEMNERSYEPWASLRPRSWMVGLAQDSFGNALELTVSSRDATEAHFFDGALRVGFERGDIGYDFAYQLARFRPVISLRHSRWVAPRTSLRVDGQPREIISETYLLAADISIRLQRGIAMHRLAAGYELRYTRTSGELRYDMDPSARPPRFPNFGLRSSLGVSWVFSNARGTARSISSEYGRVLSASINVAHPALGSDFFQISFRYRWTEYLSMPWRNHHVLALSLGGGISMGEITQNAYYLGGYPEQDFIQTALNQTFFGGNYLRGYPPGVIGGAQFHMVNSEYRFPLWNVERGVYTLPVFLSHLWVAVFCDVGGAFAQDLHFDELLVGVGGELLARFVIGYQLVFTFRLGYARGLMDGGDDQIFAVFGVPF